MSLETERERLRAQRTLLRQAHQRLERESANLLNSKDVAALSQHSARLRRHLDELHAFIDDLEEFHHRAGPIG